MAALTTVPFDCLCGERIDLDAHITLGDSRPDGAVTATLNLDPSPLHEHIATEH